MFFIARRITANLDLDVPVDFCCNCGASGEDVELVETPMKRVRYFFVIGTELTLNEMFPYCDRCKNSASRLRNGLLGKMLSACLVVSALFFAISLALEDLPIFVSENPFLTSVLLGVVITGVYYRIREKAGNGRSYYQPVSLADANVDGDYLKFCKIVFFNQKYASAFRKENQALIKTGALKVGLQKGGA